MKILEGREGPCLYSVSYTHLDVYKRQVKGRTVNENGTIRYYDANSGEMARNRFAEIEPGVWAYFNNDGAAVKGSQNINGQNLYFDQNGRQVKGALANVDGNLRYYDVNLSLIHIFRPLH